MLKVLIAEDNVMIADMLEDFLVAGGDDVCDVARTVDEAVTSADLHKPDLAVFDFRLADGGFGSQIRPRLKDQSTIGILYASGNGVTNALSSADGEAYIEKPYRMDELPFALSMKSRQLGTSPTIFQRIFTFSKILLTNSGRVQRGIARER